MGMAPGPAPGSLRRSPVRPDQLRQARLLRGRALRSRRPGARQSARAGGRTHVHRRGVGGDPSPEERRADGDPRMIAALLQEHVEAHGGGHAHEPPASIFTPAWRWFTHEFPGLSHTMGFDKEQNNLGQFWFEAICFSLVACGTLIVLAWFATRKYERVPRGLQNLLE